MSYEKQIGVLSEVAGERGNQDAKWGGAMHDDGHGQSGWRSFIRSHTTKSERPGEFRRRMIEVAALAVAAVESYDRKWGDS